MLLQIRDYMQHQKIASNQQIARELGVDQSALEPMLNRWVKKGVLEPCDKKECQSPCSKCFVNKPSFYRYID